MTTLQDVARRAGVSPITVSRVVNNSGYVAKPMRERVEAAVADLGYAPNSMARSLRLQRTNTLALIVSDITNPFFTTMARGVEDAANAQGFMVVLCNTDEHEDKEQGYLRLLVQKRADGILLVPAGDAAKSLQIIRPQEVPTVILDRRVTQKGVDVVRCDSEAGAYELGQLLVSLGHQSFAVIAGREGLTTSDDRIIGFQRALQEAGITDGAQVYRGSIASVYYGKLTQESGNSLTRQAMAAERRPTAIFAVNNFPAIGAQRALQELGLRVPEDVALVAFDDLPPVFVPNPFLTVAAQPAYEMGQKAVELLLTRLKTKTGLPFQEILMQSEVIVRRSSGDPLG